MIYKLLARCAEEGTTYTARGRSAGSANWSVEVQACSEELFQAGLPAWKIAVLFQVDFEHVEKALFLGREDYGHQKKNPFGINTDHKHLTNRKILSSTDINVTDALDAFAGEGKSTRIISDVFPAARVVAVESEAGTFGRASREAYGANVQWIHEDNLHILRKAAYERHRFDLVDLDPFVTCHEQVPLVWDCLADKALLFLTFGGEYRRSFIGTNRKAIARRYGFANFALENKAYLEVVPSFFLGWAAEKAREAGCRFDVVRAVRYANNCRFWLRVEHVNQNEAAEWYARSVVCRDAGFHYSNLDIPRFRDVRHEMNSATLEKLFG